MILTHNDASLMQDIPQAFKLCLYFAHSVITLCDCMLKAVRVSDKAVTQESSCRPSGSCLALSVRRSHQIKRNVTACQTVVNARSKDAWNAFPCQKGKGCGYNYAQKRTISHFNNAVITADSSAQTHVFLEVVFFVHQFVSFYPPLFLNINLAH